MPDIIYTYLVTYHNDHKEKREARGYREEGDYYVWTLTDGTESKELMAPVKNIATISFSPFDPTE